MNKHNHWIDTKSFEFGVYGTVETSPRHLDSYKIITIKLMEIRFQTYIWKSRLEAIWACFGAWDPPLGCPAHHAGREPNKNNKTITL
jgi:hypothetical protein